MSYVRLRAGSILKVYSFKVTTGVSVVHGGSSAAAVLLVIGGCRDWLRIVRWPSTQGDVDILRRRCSGKAADQFYHVSIRCANLCRAREAELPGAARIRVAALVHGGAAAVRDVHAGASSGRGAPSHG